MFSEISKDVALGLRAHRVARVQAHASTLSSTTRTATFAAVLGVAMALASCAPIGTLERAAYDAIQQRRAQLTTSTRTVGDVTWSLAEGGEGDVVLLLHGFSANKETWFGFARELVDDHRVLIPDLAPFGESAPKTAHCGVDAHTARLVALLDDMGIDRVHVVGNSMGGFIATHLAATHSARVSSLTLIDAAGVEMPRKSRAMRDLEAGRNLFVIDDGDGADAFFDLIFVEKPPITPSIRAAFVSAEIERRDDIARWFSELMTPTVALEPLLPKVRVPALIIWGREDQVLDVSMADVFANGLTDARVHVMGGRGHCPQIEAPSETARLVEEFLAPLTTSNATTATLTTP